ncbi:MAG: hypothetical protein ABSA01_01985 [Anaerolineales bacterium]|jgi:hypothetical protein
MPVTISQGLLPGFLSFLLTLMILSYLIGDNPAFRVAVYIFVGVSAGYIAAVVWWQVVYPKVFIALFSGTFREALIALLALILGVLLLFKLTSRMAWLGTPSLAFLVGVGAAVAVGGAVMGTIIPQTQASFNVFNLTSVGETWLERLLFGAITLVGTITTLVYFHFGARSTVGGPQRGKLVEWLSRIGQVFIAITLGVLFAGVFAAALTALIERLNFIWYFLTSIL